MLFLYQPRQTWMPYSLPRNHTQQAAYNLELQRTFAATRRVAPPVPGATEPDLVASMKELAALNASGMLTDDELDAAKAKLLGP